MHTIETDLAEMQLQNHFLSTSCHRVALFIMFWDVHLGEIETVAQHTHVISDVDNVGGFIRIEEIRNEATTYRRGNRGIVHVREYI